MADAHTWILPAILMVLAFACPLVAEWVRHRPERLQQGTQLIVLLGLLGFLAFSLLSLVSLWWLVPAP